MSFTKLKCQISEFALDVSYAMYWRRAMCLFAFISHLFCLSVYVCLFVTWIPKGRDFMETWGKWYSKSYVDERRSLIIYTIQPLKPGTLALEVHEIPLCRYDKFSFRVSCQSCIFLLVAIGRVVSDSGQARKEWG